MSEQFDPQELKGAVAAVNTAFEEFKKTNDERLAAVEKKGASDPLIDEKLTPDRDWETNCSDIFHSLL